MGLHTDANYAWAQRGEKTSTKTHNSEPTEQQRERERKRERESTVTYPADFHSFTHLFTWLTPRATVHVMLIGNLLPDVPFSRLLPFLCTPQIRSQTIILLDSNQANYPGTTKFFD